MMPATPADSLPPAHTTLYRHPVMPRAAGRRALLVALASFASPTAHSAAPTSASRMRGVVHGALVADALCLGTHYELDPRLIHELYGDMDRCALLLPPPLPSSPSRLTVKPAAPDYAPGEKTGGKTHGSGWGQRNYHSGNGNGPAKCAGEQTDYVKW